MYLDNRPLPGRDLECAECLAKSLKTWLSLGWDVHNHRLDETCGPNCAIRVTSDADGRYPSCAKPLSTERRASYW
jgi:hypothetical protein